MNNPSVASDTEKTAQSEASRGGDARILLQKLRTDFVAFRDCLPLAIGIDKEVKARMPEVDRKLLRIALGMHTHSLRYLKSMEKATHRYDLDGNAQNEVLDEHRKHATETLKERSKKDAERKRAQQEAERAERAEQQRQVKLSQLVEKFGKK